MWRIIFINGAIAGLVAIGAICLSMSLGKGEAGATSQAFGYLIMLVALTLIFIGVKRHRDVNLGGVIRFWPALTTGLAISAVAGVFYVIGWEAFLAVTDHAFIQDYANGVLERKKDAGASDAELARVAADMEAMVKNYGNPLFRLPMTFMEIFPVGLLISIVSAAVLRNPNVMPAKAQ